MVGPDGLEPSTPRLSSACSNQLSYEPVNQSITTKVVNGGAGRSRTDDPLLAKQVLYQLSYDPIHLLMYKRTLSKIYFVRSIGTQGQKDCSFAPFDHR